MPDDQGETASFKDVRMVGKLGSGFFKATPQQFGWKSLDIGGTDQDKTFVAQAVEVECASWRQCLNGGRCMLKVVLKTDAGKAHRFTNLRTEDLAALKNFFEKHYKVAITEQVSASEGWCWGDMPQLPGTAGAKGDPDLKVMVNGKLGFDLPMSELKQVNANNTDLQLSFQEPAGSTIPNEDWLSEIRFVLPGASEGSLTADFLKDELQKRTFATEGDALARVRDISIAAPRGKHDFEFFPEVVKIHGKTQTYTVRYRDIRNVFYLEQGVHQRAQPHLVVMSLNQPVAQHHHLVLQFPKKDDQNELMVPEELPPDRLKSMELNRGEKHQAHSLVTRIIREMTKKIIIAPSSNFKDLHPLKDPCIRCTYKATPGYLFFNQRSVLFCMKPVVYLKFGDVASVELHSGKMRGRSFDLNFTLKNNVCHEFTQIEFDLKSCVFRYFSEHTDVSIDNKKEVEASLETAKGRAEGRRSATVMQKSAGGADDYDEEEDGDFSDPGESDDDDTSGEEYDDGDADGPAAKRSRK